MIKKPFKDKTGFPYSSEAGAQFADIWREHNDSAKSEARKIEKNREKRKDDIKKDAGI